MKDNTLVEVVAIAAATALIITGNGEWVIGIVFLVVVLT